MNARLYRRFAMGALLAAAVLLGLIALGRSYLDRIHHAPLVVVMNKSQAPREFSIDVARYGPVIERTLATTVKPGEAMAIEVPGGDAMLRNIKVDGKAVQRDTEGILIMRMDVYGLTVDDAGRFRHGYIFASSEDAVLAARPSQDEYEFHPWFPVDGPIVISRW